MAKTKLPYLPFFVGDWVKDTRILSLETRAIWMDMLCLMHDGDRRGYLSRGGKPLTPEQVSQFCGCSAGAVSRAIQELLSSGVASCTEHGVLFSRRIVRDEEKRRQAVEYGRKGGNPKVKGGVKGRVNPPLNPPLEMEMDSSPDSEGSATGEEGGGTGGRGKWGPAMQPALPLTTGPPTVAVLVAEWFRLVARPKARRDPAERETVEAGFAELVRLGKTPADLLAAVRDERRRRAEFFWQFAERLAPAGKGETITETVARLSGGSLCPGSRNGSATTPGSSG